ncbi:MAG: hypothetical protein SFU25_11195 [Candidatus Caenarcaniphilales bacterium]|nr:hypothetical protein [Candidatus Caenarcaniphilales bacterium]
MILPVQVPSTYPLANNSLICFTRTKQYNLALNRDVMKSSSSTTQACTVARGADINQNFNPAKHQGPNGFLVSTNGGNNWTDVKNGHPWINTLKSAQALNQPFHIKVNENNPNPGGFNLDPNLLVELQWTSCIPDNPNRSSVPGNFVVTANLNMSRMPSSLRREEEAKTNNKWLRQNAAS